MGFLLGVYSFGFCVWLEVCMKVLGFDLFCFCMGKFGVLCLGLVGFWWCIFFCVVFVLLVLVMLGLVLIVLWYEKECSYFNY